MKNKFFITLFFLFNIFLLNNVYSQDFNFETNEIEIKDEGNIIEGRGGVIVTSNDNIIINSEESFYDKKKQELILTGNVVYKNTLKKISIQAEKITYDKYNEVITTYGNTIYEDRLEEFFLETKSIEYKKKDELIKTFDKAKINVKNKYTVEADKIVFNQKKSQISSELEADITDKKGNVFNFDNYTFYFNDEKVKAGNLNLIDSEKNNLIIKEAIIDLVKNEIVGKDVDLNLNKSTFGNEKNEPRLKGKSIISNDNESIIYKGAFTTCAKRDNDKCPPWAIYADEVNHDKNQKIIRYKNAWLEIYDKPILYFPKFFHPDPTVKRQSGFLAPTFYSSNNFGQSIQIPYYNVISENSDLTISPRVFFDNNIIVQNEYRRANKNSSFIGDFSFNKEDESFNTHLFSNLSGRKNDFDFELNVETVSNDNYLKTNNIKSPLINSLTVLNSFIEIRKSEENYEFTSSIESYEDLSKPDSDKYEFIYPKYSYSKTLNRDLKQKGELRFFSTGHQKHRDTNVYEGVLVNDLTYNSDQSFSKRGFASNYTLLLKNVNTNGINSSSLKEDDSYSLLSQLLFETKFPLRKEKGDNYSLLTPILSARYSPNKSKNMKNLDKRINYENIFSINRISENDTIEEGQSVTMGFEYEKYISNKKIIDFNLATNFSDQAKPDLPLKTSLNEKNSDIVGDLTISPSDYLKLGYEFSLDNNLGNSNFNLVKADFDNNHFKTSFEYLEEDNHVGEKSYISNKTSLVINESKSISLGTRKNLDKDITEYYNLIYEYKNDCLIAAVEYNKNFYLDENIRPEQNLFFSIKIIPFAEIKSPGVKK
tara:strand:- start:1229 stop:3694 length:2466 start_codon:yes stop_codon:yes gene_type:complete